MVSFAAIVLVATTFAGAFAMPGSNSTRRAGTANGAGTVNGCVGCADDVAAAH
jgi:hypothetical protein